MSTNYEETIRDYICSRCMDFGEDGLCHSKDPEGCAIYRFLPQMIDIATRIQDLKIMPYAEAVREEICSYCRNRHPDGKCSVRESLSCALDRYLPLVVEALEYARNSNGKRKGVI